MLKRTAVLAGAAGLAGGGVRAWPDRQSRPVTSAPPAGTDEWRHDAAMTRMIDQIEARIGMLRLTARDKAEALGLEFGRVGPVLDAARAAVADRTLGYALPIAEKTA